MAVKQANAMNIDRRRLNNPQTISPAEIADHCATHGDLVIQFDKPDAYTPQLLEALNEACRLAGEHLEVRFYGHYWAPFDAACLQYLPQVRNLAADCLRKIKNEDEIGRLPELKYLSFQAFELDRPDFLDTLDLGRLVRFSVGENRKRNLDLSGLGRCRVLEELAIAGQARGIDVIGQLPRLRYLLLASFAKKYRLDFIEAMPALKELKLLLGGRDDIDELKSRSLETIRIIRVRGLATMGDLARLPALSTLHVEDQLKLASLDLSGADLRRVFLVNCRNLSDLQGLDAQKRLEELHVYRVALDMDALRDRQWPPTMRAVSLLRDHNRWNAETKESLARRNLDGTIVRW